MYFRRSRCLSKGFDVSDAGLVEGVGSTRMPSSERGTGRA